ncbi:serine/arginine repetitive matrix protein 1-like isoform X2 [Ostrea edulis]|nr:serine/arginine repetitive matrix protein 1-like isoform X2 [Ostrea edulis]
MATLVNNPLDNNLSGSKPALDDSLNTGEFIQLKEAKLNQDGVLQYRDTVLDKENLHLVGSLKNTEKDIVKHDIAKWSKDNVAKNDSDGKTEVTASSRPVTGVSVKHVGDEKADTARDAHSPSKRNGIRSYSEYGRSTNIARQSVLAPGKGRFDPIPTPNSRDYRSMPSPPPKHIRVPTKLIRLATVTMSAKTKPAPRPPMSSLYYEEPKKPKKVIGWDEAHSARPPLRIDMEGPGPCTYSPQNKPLYETNAPSWSFGSKTQPDKDGGGGGRTSWEKSWFQSPHLYQQKTDFFSDNAWPTPSTYSQRPLLGPRQRTVMESPSFSIGIRRKFDLAKPESTKQPSPVDYERKLADKVVFQSSPAYSHQLRRDGTILWSHNEKTPGPAAYSPRVEQSKLMRPAFTIRSLRREKSHVLGPFSTF